MEIGELIDGKYELVRMLGRGAMGTVYLAEHRILGKKVAIKVLHEQFTDNAVFVERFYREARSAASVGHRGIVEVHDIGQTPDGSLFLVMEYLDGQSLSALLKARKTLEITEALGITHQILSALAVVHDKGIIHRDIKPGNIFLCVNPDGPPVVKLLDFGVSKMAKGLVPDITSDRDVVGTLSYMAPEQARRSRDADQQSDIWAVGAILYQMLVGRLPHRGGSIDQVLISLMTEKIVPPQELRKEISDELDAAIMKALQRDVSSRHASALEFIASLAAARMAGDPHRSQDQREAGSDATVLDEDGPTGLFSTPRGIGESNDVAPPEGSLGDQSAAQAALDEDREISSPSQAPDEAVPQHHDPDRRASEEPLSHDSAISCPSAPYSETPSAPGYSSVPSHVPELGESLHSGALDTLAAVITTVRGALPPRALWVVAIVFSVMVLAVFGAIAAILLSSSVHERSSPTRGAAVSGRIATPHEGRHEASADGPPQSVSVASPSTSEVASFESADGSPSPASDETRAAVEEPSTEAQPLTTEEISMGLRRIRPSVQRCLDADATAPAKVYVSVMVDGDGTTHFRGATPRPNAVALQCVRRTVEALRFRSADGPDLEMRFPYSPTSHDRDQGSSGREGDASSSATEGSTPLKRSPFRR